MVMLIENRVEKNWGVLGGCEAKKRYDVISCRRSEGV